MPYRVLFNRFNNAPIELLLTKQLKANKLWLQCLVLLSLTTTLKQDSEALANHQRNNK